MQDQKNVIDPVQCRIKAEQAIINKEPFYLITLHKDGCCLLKHVGDCPDEQKAINSHKLDIALMDMTNHVNPIIKMKWLMGQLSGLTEGEDNDDH